MSKGDVLILGKLKKDRSERQGEVATLRESIAECSNMYDLEKTARKIVSCIEQVEAFTHTIQTVDIAFKQAENGIREGE